VSTIHFTGFANAQAFDSKAQSNVSLSVSLIYLPTDCTCFTWPSFMCSMQFISAIETPLKAAGYNVQVINVMVSPGSILVTSTTEFLDGSTTGAADFEAALGDTGSVQALFPSSVYGTVVVTSVKTESVSNPSKFCRDFKVHLVVLA